MKTTPWTPSASLNESTWAIDDIVIFSSDAAKVDNSGQLLSALLAGAAYAGMNLPFQVFSSSRDELLRFTPGTPVEGVPELVVAIREIAMHMDKQVRDALAIRLGELRAEVTAQFDQHLAAATAEIRAQLEAEYGVRDAGETAAQPDSPQS